MWFVKYNCYCLQCKENDAFIDVYHKQSLWNKMSKQSITLMSCLKWFLTEWCIGMICEIQFLLQLISAMQRKWFVHWCLS